MGWVPPTPPDINDPRLTPEQRERMYREYRQLLQSHMASMPPAALIIGGIVVVVLFMAVLLISFFTGGFG